MSCAATETVKPTISPLALMRKAKGSIVNIQNGKQAPASACEAVNHRNFFSELKRRNVYKVAVAYVAAHAIMNRAASRAAPKEPGSACAHAAAAIRSLVKVIRPQKI